MALENLTGCVTATYDEGGFVLVLGIDEREDWLAPIAAWAARHQYTWVRFDADGDVVDGLEVYDWDAGDGSGLVDIPFMTPAQKAELMDAPAASNSLLDNKED
jgi:hypothetical protein